MIELCHALGHVLGTAIPDVAWVLSDPGATPPDGTPFGFIYPVSEAGEHRTLNVDLAAVTAQVLIVEDLRKYGQVQAVGGEPYRAHPGFDALLELAGRVRSTLRANILLDHHMTSTTVPRMEVLPVIVDGRSYRAVRITVSARLRRTR